MQQITVQDKAAQRLLARNPAETDAVLAELLRQRSGLSVVSKEKNTFHDNGTVTSERLPSYVQGTASDDDIRRAIADYELALTPAPLPEIVKLVSVLRVTTASRGTDGQDSELQLEAYSRALAAFPADVVASVLKRLRKWFPTLVELVEECEAATAPRREIIRSLQSKLLFGEAEAIAKPEKPQITDDERASLVAKFAGVRATIAGTEKQQPKGEKWKSPDEIMAELEVLRDVPLEVSPRLKALLQEQMRDDAMMRAIRENIAKANQSNEGKAA